MIYNLPKSLFTLHGTGTGTGTGNHRFIYYTMYCTHCTGPEMGQGPGNTGLYITLCTVHTAQDRDRTGTGNHRFIYYTMYCSHCTGQEPGQGPGTTGLYITLCTVHTAQDRNQDRDWEPQVYILHYVLFTLHGTGNGTGTGNHRFIYIPHRDRDRER